MAEHKLLRVTSIRVKGLFGYYNHVIDLNQAERVTILHGPNGIGKTKILQMVKWLLGEDSNKGEDYKKLQLVPFESFEIGLSNGAQLVVTRRDTVYLKLAAGDVSETALPIPRAIPLFSEIVKTSPSNPLALGYAKAVHCLFIETQRLLRFDLTTDEYGQPNEPYHRVEHIAQELARIVSDTMARYGRESQTLDQSYPQRVLAKAKTPLLAPEELKQRLQSLEQSQNALRELGLLNQADAAPPDLSDLANLNDTERRAMTLYVTDTEKKLSVLKDIAERIRLLLQVSPKFLRKRIRLDREKGLVAENDRGQPLTLEVLSSGEQHELVLHFDLLFRIKPNTLVLIDEPELSLHVTWQKQFLPNLLEIAKTVGIDIVVATHSPFIIGDRTDLMVALEDEVG